MYVLWQPESKTWKSFDKGQFSVPTHNRHDTTAQTDLGKADLLNSFVYFCYNLSHSPLSALLYRSVEAAVHSVAVHTPKCFHYKQAGRILYHIAPILNASSTCAQSKLRISYMHKVKSQQECCWISTSCMYLILMVIMYRLFKHWVNLTQCTPPACMTLFGCAITVTNIYTLWHRSPSSYFGINVIETPRGTMGGFHSNQVIT